MNSYTIAMIVMGFLLRNLAVKHRVEDIFNVACGIICGGIGLWYRGSTSTLIIILSLTLIIMGSRGIKGRFIK